MQRNWNKSLNISYFNSKRKAPSGRPEKDNNSLTHAVGHGHHGRKERQVRLGGSSGAYRQCLLKTISRAVSISLKYIQNRHFHHFLIPFPSLHHLQTPPTLHFHCHLTFRLPNMNSLIRLCHFPAQSIHINKHTQKIENKLG